MAFVAIDSARVSDVASEEVVEVEHTKLTQDPCVIDDVLTILEQHYLAVGEPAR